MRTLSGQATLPKRRKRAAPEAPSRVPRGHRPSPGPLVENIARAIFEIRAAYRADWFAHESHEPSGK